MKLKSLLIPVLAFATLLFFGVPESRAGELNASAVTVTWDDSTFYEPAGCTNYYFNFTADVSVLFATISISNTYGDSIGSTMITGPNTGKASVFICSGKDLSGTKVILDVKKSSFYGGGEQIVSSPITFLKRGTPSPTPVATIPIPTPTVTVTATPLPAPTVTVTAQPSTTELELANAKLKLAQRDLSTITAKLKKICSVKPKPKGC